MRSWMERAVCVLLGCAVGSFAIAALPRESRLDTEMWGREGLLEDIYTTCRDHKGTATFASPDPNGWNAGHYRYFMECSDGTQAWETDAPTVDGKIQWRALCGHDSQGLIPCTYPERYATYRSDEAPYRVLNPGTHSTPIPNWTPR